MNNQINEINFKQLNKKTTLSAISKTGTKEWADTNVNILNGCSNNCKYCYAKEMAKRFKRKTSENWKDEILLTEKINKKYNKRDGRIMYPSSHDITEKYLNEHIFVIQNILEKGNDILIVSKPRFECIKKICDTFSQYKTKILFRFTIGSSDNDVLNYWEPNAPTLSERLKSLQYAYKAGYQTSVSAEPLLDSDPVKLYEATSEFITDKIWFGLMRDSKKRLSINCPNDTDAQECAASLANKQDRAFVLNLYDIYKDNLKVAWKDSITRILKTSTIQR